MLYVGLGTTAIGSVIFFVGTGEKGFKTLELRLIGITILLVPIEKHTLMFFLGPTLIACGLLCCLIRVLLCACPSTCFRKRKKTRLKSGCPHTSSKYPLAPQRRDRSDFAALDKASLLTKQQHKKKVCIAPPTHPIPSTSTMDFQEHTAVVVEEDEEERKEKGGWIYQIHSFLAVRRNLPWSWILDKAFSNLKGIYVRESVSKLHSDVRIEFNLV